MCVDGRRGAAVIATAAYAGCLAVAAVLSVLDGRARSMLIVPLALVFFWGYTVLIWGLVGVIFGERQEEATRAGMLFVGVCAAMVGLGLLALATKVDSDAVRYGLRFLSSAGFWVCLGMLLGAIVGKLPEVEMAEGD